MGIALQADIDELESEVSVTDDGFSGHRFPFPALIESELVIVDGGSFFSAAADGTYKLGLERGAFGSAPASHVASTAITPVVLGVANALTEAANVAAIADTSTATAEDVGDKVNEVIAALIAAGLMAAS